MTFHNVIAKKMAVSKSPPFPFKCALLGSSFLLSISLGIEAAIRGSEDGGRTFPLNRSLFT